MIIPVSHTANVFLVGTYLHLNGSFGGPNFKCSGYIVMVIVVIIVVAG
jgi:hypothetical protein